MGLVCLHLIRWTALNALGWMASRGQEVRRRGQVFRTRLQHESVFRECVGVPYLLGVRARCNQALMSLFLQCLKAAMART